MQHNNRRTADMKELIGKLIDSPMEFLSEYYRRENSELQFSADKKTTG